MTDTTTQSLPSYLVEPTKTALTGIENFNNSANNYVYGSKPGESLYTGMNAMQNEALGNTKALSDQDLSKMFGFDEANSMWGSYANSGAEYANPNGTSTNPGDYGRAAGQLSTHGIFDGSGPLGQFSDYMNPFVGTVLDPQIREISQQSDRNRNNIGAQANMAGAFGDARHGIMEGQNYEKTDQAISDATGKAYADAFMSALQSRQSDMGRFDTMQVQNANIDEGAAARKAGLASGNQNSALQIALANQRAEQNANERVGTAATAKAGLGQSLFELMNTQNNNLLNAGTIAQSQEELKRQTQQQFQEALKNNDYNSMIRLLSAVNGAPKEMTSTTSSSPNWSGILASALSAGLL